MSQFFIKTQTKTKALSKAVELSKDHGFATVIYSSDPDEGSSYHVETEVVLIRNWETLIAEYEDGKKIR